MLDYARTHPVSLTCRHFGIARSTFSCWHQRFDPWNLISLERRSSRPHRYRQPTWQPKHVAAVQLLRERFPRWGKATLQPLLAQEGIVLSSPGVRLRYHFTAVAVVLRWNALGVRSSASAGTAEAFLAEVLDRMPFPVRAIQVDGDSEFKADFEMACQARRIPCTCRRPGSPKLNGHVERAHRTHRQGFSI